jgi:hypothetical protein
MSLKALRTELLNSTPFMHLGAELRPVPAKRGGGK